MAYMRHPFYVWSDGEAITIIDTETSGSVIMPLELFDALVVMRHAQLLEAHRESPGRTGMDEYSKRVADQYEGHAGADALRRVFGMKDVMGIARDAIADLERPPDT